MAGNPVISNTTPLIALSGINLLSLLQDLYTEVWIPREVESEFLAIDETIHREMLNNSPWIKTVDLTNLDNAPIYTDLDPGEAGVFALASEHDVQLVILDDQKARREAENIGLPVTGTVGVLLEAKEKGLINTIKPLLLALRENGLYLSNSVIVDALREAGEI